MTILSQYMGLEVLQPGYQFTDSGVYKIPGDVIDSSTGKLVADSETPLDVYVSYVQSLPIVCANFQL